jgi:predicted alpha/beta superfamily hydrolase
MRLSRRRALALSGLCALPSKALSQQRRINERFTIPTLNRERTVRIVLPSSYARAPQKRYPVLYLHDGQNLFDAATSFAGEWGMDETLDALAAATGFEAIAIGIDHGGDKRRNELNPWPHERFGAGEGEAYLDFIVKVLKPSIDARYRSRPEPASTLIGGSSMGGLISHAGITRHPEVFGLALVFSPAYWVGPAMLAMAEQRRLPSSARVYFYAGGKENDTMVPHTQRMHALLQSQGVATQVQVALDAEHNEAAWRAALDPALRWLFKLQPR